MRRSTNGQIQIGESLAVIIVFIVLVFFGLAWFASSSTVSNELAIDNANRLALLEKTKELMNLPELGCSINERSEQICLDLYRARAIKNLTTDDPSIRSRYQEQFANYEVTVEILYPDIPGTNNITILDFAPNKNYAASSYIPIVTYNPSTNTRHLSVLKLTQWRAE